MSLVLVLCVGLPALAALACGLSGARLGDSAGRLGAGAAALAFAFAVVLAASVIASGPVSAVVGDGAGGAGSAAQGNLQAVTLVMSRDVQTAPLFLRPTGQNHPRQIFPREDPVVEVLRQWAQK